MIAATATAMTRLLTPLLLLLLSACGAEQAPAPQQGAAAQKAEPPPPLVVYKSPTCGCCGAWAEYMQAEGFTVEVVEEPQINKVKARLGVPAELGSCHTATIDGYVIEGHVPAEDVRRLLRERPAAAGLAVPGMPLGSPGMEVGDRRQPYTVWLYGVEGASEPQAWAQHQQPGQTDQSVPAGAEGRAV